MVSEQYRQLDLPSPIGDFGDLRAIENAAFGYNPLSRTVFDSIRSTLGTLILDRWEHGLLETEGLDHLKISDTHYALMAIRRGEKSERILIANRRIDDFKFEPRSAIVIETYVDEKDVEGGFTIRHLDLSKLDNTSENEDWIQLFCPNEELDPRLLEITGMGDLNYSETCRLITYWFGIDAIL